MSDAQLAQAPAEQSEEVLDTTPVSESPEVNEEQEALENSKNPERTKAYIDKLKAQLKEKEAQTPTRPSLLEAYMTQAPQVVPPVQPVQTPQVQEQRQWVSEDGVFNASELDKRLSEVEEARKRAEAAERKAQETAERVARFEIDTQKKALYQEYPELDPSNEKFNEEAYDLVKKELLDQMVTTGQQNAVKAASKMSKYFRTAEPKNTEVLVQRAQATQGYTVARTSKSSVDPDLRKRSMTDPEAMEERMRRAGI